MSLKQVYDEQPKEFKFSNENLKKAEEILKKYLKHNQICSNSQKKILKKLKVKLTNIQKQKKLVQF